MTDDQTDGKVSRYFSTTIMGRQKSYLIKKLADDSFHSPCYLFFIFIYNNLLHIIKRKKMFEISVKLDKKEKKINTKIF